MARKQNCCLLLTLFLSTGLLFSSCSAPKGQPDPGQEPSYQTGSDDDWEIAESGNVRLENERIILDFDAATTHFTLTERKTGRVYRSVPESVDTAISEEVQERMTSELTAVYYDSESNRLYMTSDRDSVSHEAVVVKKKDNTLRVYYTLGNNSGRLLAPQIFTREFFENELCTAECFSSSQIRRLKRYYDLYTPEEPGEEYQAMKERYPILSTHALYIRKDTVDDLNLIEIDEYMQLFGYTEEQYQKDLAALGISEGQSDEAGFVIPVEYSLEKDGFSARILMDKVTETSGQFTLQQIAFLEYFGCAGPEQNGYFLVPDGSGALIALNQGGNAYAQRVYGADAARDKKSAANLEQQVCLPVFGASFGKDGLFAMIENAEEAAEIFAETISESVPQNHIYAAFHVREMEATDIGADRDILSFQLYSKQRLAESPKIRYVCLSGETTGYSDMAAYYRQYLLENGMLVKRETSSGLLLNYWGLAVENASFLGIPYDSRLVLSRLEEISGDLKKLEENGISDAAVRLQGYGDAGLTHRLNHRFSLSGKVGSTDALLALREQLSGGGLYLEADFQLVYEDGWFDSFSPKADSARSLSKKIAVVKPHDFVTRAFFSGKQSRYLVSPARFAEVAGGFLSSLEQTLSGGTDIGVSYRSAASLLTGDYNAANEISRVQTAETVRKAVETAAASRPVLSDVGNLYAVSGLSRIDNIPMRSSEYDIISDSVPFYQMVIHGYVPYSGVPINLSSDPEEACLKAVEYGAGLSFSLCTGDEMQLNATELGQYYYSLSSARQLPKVIARYQAVRSVYAAVADSRFVSHEKLAERVYRSTFDNGVQVMVNYQSEPVTIDSSRIPANGFIMLQNGSITEGTV